MLDIVTYSLIIDLKRKLFILQDGNYNKFRCKMNRSINSNNKIYYY